MTDVVREVTSICRTVSEGSALAACLTVFSETWSCTAHAHRPALGERGWLLEFFHTAGKGRNLVERTHGAYERFLAQQTGSEWTAYSPLRPPDAHRNVVMDGAWMQELQRRPEPLPLIEEVYRPAGLLGHDQMRVLACDGPLLLSWVGAFRENAFQPDEVAEFSRSLPALLKRLRLEQRVDDRLGVHVERLNRLSVPAFLLRLNGVCVHANDTGRALIERKGSAVLSVLRELSHEPLTVSLPGLPYLLLVVLSAESPTFAERIRHAQQRWRLTRRQTDVLALVVAGDGNKEIANKLGCAMGTVELHVSAILAKAKLESRTRLIAAVWAAG